jgi:hypothetical protein
MINNEYFDIYHGNRESAPDGLADKSTVLAHLATILDLLFEMKPYMRRGPAFTAARIVEYAAADHEHSTDRQEATVALVTMLVVALRKVVSNDPTRTVKNHLQNMFDVQFIHKLHAELSALPYRSVATDEAEVFTECEDYSVLSVLCDRFPLEYVIEESEVDDEILNYEIIDEADIEPESDEEG